MRDNFSIGCIYPSIELEYDCPEGDSYHKLRNNHKKEYRSEPNNLEDNDDVHKEADTTEYAGKIGDNPWKEKAVTVKESSKDGKQVGEEKDEVQDDGDG